MPHESDRKALDEALSVYRKQLAVPCTACKYCLPCPLEIDIPSVFTIYNQFKRTIDIRPRFPGIRQMELKMLEQAKTCVSCKQCLNRCPQKINIPEAHRQVVKDEMKRNV